MYSLIKQNLFSSKGILQHGREYIECSQHGICDYNTGTCKCYHGFKSSDGYGNSGTIGDCGYQYLNDLYYNYDSTQVFTNCPFNDNDDDDDTNNGGGGGICSGHGTCNEGTGICSCNDGYGKL